MAPSLFGSSVLPTTAATPPLPRCLPVKMGAFVTVTDSYLDDFCAATGPLQTGLYGEVVQHELANERPFKVTNLSDPYPYPDIRSLVRV